MATTEKLTCSECGAEFEFDPESNEKVITSLNELFKPRNWLIWTKHHRNIQSGNTNGISSPFSSVLTPEVM